MGRAVARSFKYFIVLAATLIIIVMMINNSSIFLKRSYPLEYKEQVLNYSSKNGLDPYLVFAIIKAESSFDPKATSSKNAKGLMQITDRTGKWGAQSLKLENFATNDLYDPDTNIRIGCWYLGRLMKEFKNDLNLVIAAYNGGSGNVNEWLKDKSLSSSGDTLEKIPFKETDKYLKKVKNFYSVYKRLYENNQ